MWFVNFGSQWGAPCQAQLPVSLDTRHPPSAQATTPCHRHDILGCSGSFMNGAAVQVSPGGASPSTSLPR